MLQFEAMIKQLSKKVKIERDEWILDIGLHSKNFFISTSGNIYFRDDKIPIYKMDKNGNISITPYGKNKNYPEDINPGNEIFELVSKAKELIRI
ncbi:MAG: hypothetical protein QXD48_00025 [Candidatus Aenigmatarchaeota archaeon]